MPDSPELPPPPPATFSSSSTFSSRISSDISVPSVAHATPEPPCPPERQTKLRAGNSETSRENAQGGHFRTMREAPCGAFPVLRAPGGAPPYRCLRQHCCRNQRRRLTTPSRLAEVGNLPPEGIASELSTSFEGFIDARSRHFGCARLSRGCAADIVLSRRRKSRRNPADVSPLRPL